MTNFNQVILNGFLFATILIVSCSKTENDKALFTSKDEKAIIALQKSYGLNVFDQEASEAQKDQIIRALGANSKYFQKIEDKINKSNIRLFTNSNENTTVAVFSFSNDINRLFAAKGSFLKGHFSISKELLVGKQIANKGTGQVVIMNGEEALLINSVNGVEDIQQMNIGTAEYKIFQTTDQYGNHGGNGFCQRQAGESFSTCYKAEKDEFCDGFFSCLAVDTQPQVMLLIAAACSCGAS